MGILLHQHMWVISRKRLSDFWEIYPDAEKPLRVWYTFADTSSWNNPNEVKAIYPSMSILGNDRYCFDIGGNKYRLIVKIDFEKYRVYIRFIGTHKQYDRLSDASKV